MFINSIKRQQVAKIVDILLESEVPFALYRDFDFDQFALSISDTAPVLPAIHQLLAEPEVVTQG